MNQIEQNNTRNGSAVAQWQSAFLETEGPPVGPHRAHCFVSLSETLILA